MPEYLMDRIFNRLAELNDRWSALVQEIPKMDPKQTQKEVGALRMEFANIITLAQKHNWRLLAESEGIEIPDEASDEAGNEPS